jgi:uncharacterized protein
MMALAFLAIALSFTLSASAGLGGSLILVPALSLLLDTKQGVALAALLLAGNNVMKLVAYRGTIPIRASLGVLALTMLGAWLGASLMVSCPELWVHIGIALAMVLTLAFERCELERGRRAATAPFALLAGASSGFTGTSGPLKGLALRNLGLDRLHFVGAASLVSLGGDLMKTAVFARAELFDQTTSVLAIGALPLMPMAAYAGRHLNRRIGERSYAILFWTVMTGYVTRLFV